MDRDFFELTPSQTDVVQTITAPPEPEFEMPASVWSVHADPYAWEVETHFVGADMQPTDNIYYTAYFTPAFEGYFWTMSMLPKPWSDLVSKMEAADPSHMGEFFVMCPKTVGATAAGQTFANRGPAAMGPFAIRVQPADRLAAVGNEVPTPSLQSPPNVTEREIRQMAWGTMTWAFELSEEIGNACVALVNKQHQLGDQRRGDTLTDVKNFLEITAKAFDVLNGASKFFGF